MYLTESDLENFILQDIDPSFSTWITSVISMVEAYVDQYCGTTFANSTAETRYFDGSGNNELPIGPCQSLTSVQLLNIDGNVLATLTATTDYYLYPLNDTIKNKLVLAPAGQYQAFPEQARGVKIAGTWGYSAVPAPVKFCAIQLAAQIINTGLRGGQVSSETLGSYRIDYREVDETMESLGIKETLNLYRVMNFGEV